MAIRPHIAVFAVLLLTHVAASADASPQETDDLQAITATLTAQADAWDNAIVRKDRAAIETNMAEDFRQIDGAGNVETKRSFVDGIVSPDLEIDPYTVEDFDVRLYGDVALLSGRTRMTGRYRGESFTSHYRYIDIYARRGDEWKIVSVQISRIPNPPPAQADAPAADETQVVKALETMYVAATNDDLALFSSVAAPDFYAFDGGKRFTGNSLMEFIRKLHVAGSVYAWTVKEPEVHVSGDVAWITYVNRGSVEDKSGKIDLAWLESAVLRKDSGVWRIHFFHSTRAP